eukprot:gene9862-6934_t
MKIFKMKIFKPHIRQSGSARHLEKQMGWLAQAPALARLSLEHIRNFITLKNLIPPLHTKATNHRQYYLAYSTFSLLSKKFVSSKFIIISGLTLKIRNFITLKTLLVFATHPKATKKHFINYYGKLPTRMSTHQVETMLNTPLLKFIFHQSSGIVLALLLLIESQPNLMRYLTLTYLLLIFASFFHIC